MPHLHLNNPNIKKLLDTLNISKEDIHQHSQEFVPYLYLDGHRSSCVGENEIDQYKSGFDFFLRFTDILKTLGFKQLVTMVHTFRNMQVTGRIEAIKTATQESIISKLHTLEDSNINLYGNLELYKEIGFDDFYNFLKTYSSNSNGNSFHHHILTNYSEDWAIKNLNKFEQMPNISSVIRFTKGHVSGGWIPFKMQETTSVYSQIPSVAEFWSDDGILALILITFSNWLKMKDSIGQKSYNENEKEKIHKVRDIELNFVKMNISANSPNHNRILVFDPSGPIEYKVE